MENVLNDPKYKDIRISCVLTAINEGKTVKKVVNTLITYPYFYDIVLVNDGSKDDTLEILQNAAKKSKKVKVINNKVNKGKTQGILSAVNKAKGELIVAVDADLVNLKHLHIDSLIKPVITNQYCMTILDRGSDSYSPIGWMQFIANRPYGGERAFWKKDFLEIPLEGNERYGLETIMNDYYIRKNKKILSIYTPDLISLYKSQKYKNTYNSLLEWGGQLRDMAKSSKFNSALKQSLEIEDNRLSRLHKAKEKSRIKSPIVLSIFIAGLTLSIATFAALNLKRGVKEIKDRRNKRRKNSKK